MSAKRAPATKSHRPLPAHLTHQGMQTIRQMVLRGQSNREIARHFGIYVELINSLLIYRRERWLAERREGRVDCLPGKTVVFRKIRHLNGDVSIRPFSLAPGAADGGKPVSEAAEDPIKYPFRVHFHDGKTFDFRAVNPLVAERKARAAHPGGFVKKVKRIREQDYDSSNA